MAAVVINAKSFQKNVRRIQQQVGRQLQKSVVNGGTKLIEITRPDVPIDKGNLQRGGGVHSNMSSQTYAQAQVQFSQHAPHNMFNYAEIQHERTDFNHPRGGKDHYLSDNVEGQTQFIIEIMAKTIKEVL